MVCVEPTSGTKKNLHISENRNYTADHDLHICYHLKTFFENLDLVKSFFPDFFNRNNEEEEEEEHLEEFNYNTQRIKQENTEDGTIHTEIKGYFNTQLGLWEYPAVSQHKPMEMMDRHLVNETGDQNEYTVALRMNPDTGLYGTYHLMPSRSNEDGSEEKCSCVMSFHKDGILKEKGTLYTRNGPVEIKYYDMVCQRGLCTVPFTDAVKEKGIFIFTHATAAGDEIGWDFINRVLKTKCSFTSYCTELSRKYQDIQCTIWTFHECKNFYFMVLWLDLCI